MHQGCFLPLNAIAVHPQGFEKFCLTSTLKISPDKKEYEQQRIEIHKRLLKGEWPSSCSFCLNKEKRNLQSRRTRTLERKSQRYGSENLQQMLVAQDLPRIRHLEISFSNTCNLACAMCSSEFSTSWIPLDKMATQEGLEFRDFTKPYMKSTAMSDTMMDEVLKHAAYFELILIKGGEPTYETQCLKFLRKLSELRKDSSLLVFIQSNGTRSPQEWLPATEGLNLEVGYSFDGYGEIHEWIRNTSFDKIENNFLYLDQQKQIRSLSVDFTLSLFNCFHLPDFLRAMLKLKSEMQKLDLCPVFQWAQQPYASPLNLKLEDRLAILKEVEPLLRSAPEFFQNLENMLRVLALPRASVQSQADALRWTHFMNKSRKKSIFDLEPRLLSSLSPAE